MVNTIKSNKARLEPMSNGVGRFQQRSFPYEIVPYCGVGVGVGVVLNIFNRVRRYELGSIRYDLGFGGGGGGW